MRQLRPLLALDKCGKLRSNANAIWDALALGPIMRNFKCNAMMRAICAMMRAFLNQGGGGTIGRITVVMMAAPWQWVTIGGSDVGGSLGLCKIIKL